MTDCIFLADLLRSEMIKQVGFLNWGYFVYIINYIYIEGHLLFMGIKSPGIDQQIIKKPPRESHIIHGRPKKKLMLLWTP